MKVLFIAQHIPYAESNGVEVKISNLLKCMREVAEVIPVYLVDRLEEKRPAASVGEESSVIVRKSSNTAVLRYLNHLREVLVVEKEVKVQIGGIIERVQPDLIWLEFGYICHLVPFLRKYGIPICYGSHNSQWKLDLQIWQANDNPVDKIKMAPFMALYWLHERFLMPLADRFFCISNHDVDYYRRFVPHDRLSLLPFFFDCRRLESVPPLAPGHPYLCLVGSLRSYQNYAAALYALDEVWPRVHPALEHLHLYIIGELPDENSREYRVLMQKKETLPNVVLAGKVPSVIAYVKGAHVNIVPLTLGSGVRTKIIESTACRTPVVSTSIGAEGLPLENGKSILLADDPAVFSDLVQKLVTDRERRLSLAEQAYQAYRKELSLEAGTAALAAIFAAFEGRARAANGVRGSTP